MWTSTGQLGDVQSGQQTGYLFPMGPFFAVGHAFGYPGLDRAAPVARNPPGARRLGGRAAARRAARTPARRRAPRRGRGHPPQPLRRHLRQPHHGHAARVRGVAVAAARRAPGAARVAPMAMAGGLRAAGRGLRGRDQRRRDGVDAARPGAAAVLRDRVHADRVEAGARLCVAHAADHGAHVAVVDRPRVRAVLLRDRLPALHRAAGHDLGHHQRDRDAAPDELLAVLRRDRLQRARDPVLRRPAHAAVLAAGRDRDAAGPGGRAGRLRVDAQMALRTVLPGPGLDRRTGDAGGVSRRDGASPRPDVRLQPLRIGSVPARVLQGRAAAGRVPGVPGGGRRGTGVVAAGRDLAPRDRARGRRRRAGTGRLAVGHRQGPGPPGLLQGDPGRMARGGARCQPGAAAQLPGDGAPRRPVLVLHLGRHRRPDPAGAVQAVGGRTHRGPVRRPAGNGSAVDGRRARAPAPARAGPARAAAVADGRAPGHHRHR